jgi:hypothetical protein
MIDRHKHDLALLSLHELLVTARRMAYERVAYAKLAVVLDWAEVLPRYLVEKRDRTREFHDALRDLASIDGRFRPALARFEQAA